MRWRPFYVCSLAAVLTLMLPMTLWSTEISEAELTALETTFDELRTLNAELQSRLQTAERLQIDAADSLIAADQSFRLYERASTEALRETREARDRAQAEAELARILGIGATILAGLLGLLIGHAIP